MATEARRGKTFVKDGGITRWCPRIGATRWSASGATRCTPGFRVRGAGRKLARASSGQDGRTRTEAPWPSPTSGRGGRRRSSTSARVRTCSPEPHPWKRFD
eukprot:1865886-Heterocapsa_arctica.AAC.1